MLSTGRSDLVILRRSRHGQILLAIHNLTPSRLTLALGGLVESVTGSWTDCLNGSTDELTSLLQLEPYAVHWLIQS